jgi:predicted AAA+ superfamily ATPase
MVPDRTDDREDRTESVPKCRRRVDRRGAAGRDPCSQTAGRDQKQGDGDISQGVGRLGLEEEALKQPRRSGRAEETDQRSRNDRSRRIAHESGNLLNKADLARDVGISPSTANQWLSVAEASGQIVLLEPWFSNRTKSLVKTPKLYLADTGVLCALLNVRSPKDLAGSPSVGAIWETFVFSELRHREGRRRRTGSLFFWRDRTREVDFLVETAGRIELFEAKWTEAPTAGDTANLAFARKSIGEGRVSGTVLCRTPNAYPLGDGFRAKPIDDL